MVPVLFLIQPIVAPLLLRSVYSPRPTSGTKKDGLHVIDTNFGCKPFEVPIPRKYNLCGAAMTSAPAYVSLHDARKLTAWPIMVRFDLIEEKKGYMAANSSWVKRLEHITCQVRLCFRN